MTKSKNKGKQEEAAKDEQDYNINSINEDIGLISTGVPHTTVEGIEVKTKSKKIFILPIKNRIIK